MHNNQPTDNFFLSLLENSTDLISIIDPAGNYKFVGGSVKNILGFTPQELVGLSAFGYIHEEDRVVTAQALANALERNVTTLPHFRFRTKNGEWRWLECKVTNQMQNPTIQGYVTNTRDVTDQVEEEQKKKKTQAHYESLFYNHPDAVFELNGQGHFVRINKTVSLVLGYEHDQILGVHFSRFVHQDHMTAAMEAFVSTMAGNTRYLELSVVRKGGEIGILGITVLPVIIQDQVVSLQGIAKDITLNKNYDLYIKAQADQLNSIMERIPESFFSLDSNWCYTYVNAFYVSYLKKPGEALLNCNIWEMFPVMRQTRFYRECLQVAQTGLPVNFEESFPHRNGSTLHFHLFSTKNGISVHFVDVTEKKREQDRLEKLSLVASRATTAVMILDKQGRIEWVNEAFENVTGFSLAECYLKKPGDFLAGEETSAKAIAKIRQKMEQARPFKGEILNYTKTGQKLWFYMEITPIFDEAGMLSTFISIRTDITEKKTKEGDLMQVARDLFKQNRDLQQFSYMVSHHLRAPAANIMGLTELLDLTNKGPDLYEDIIQKIQASAHSLDQVIRDMNHILSIRENNYALEQEEVHLALVCREVLSRLQYKLVDCPHTISTSVDEAISLFSNRTYLFEILKNLLSNAIKFRKPEQVLKLELKALRKGNAIELVVQDNGIGMDISLVKKSLFQLYRKFHAGYPGRGLGLFLAKTYVDALGGSIKVKSAPGKGTAFYVKFKSNVEQSLCQEA